MPEDTKPANTEAEATEAMEDAKRTINEAQKYALRSADDQNKHAPDRQEQLEKMVADALANQAKAAEFQADQDKRKQEAADYEAIKAEREELKARLATASAHRKVKFYQDSAPEGWLHGPAKDDNEREARKLHDDLLTVAKTISKRDEMPIRDAMKQSVEIAKADPKYGSIIKAMSTTGEGADWLSVGYSDQFIPRIEAPVFVEQLFYPWTIPNGQSSLVVPGLNARMSVYKVSENTSDSPTAMPKSNATDRKITLAPETFAVTVYVSYELDEDAIIPATTLLNNDVSSTFSRKFEQAYLDGDSDGTHFDDDIPADGANYTDVRKAFNGVVRHAVALKVTSSANAVDLSTFTVNRFRTAYGIMGEIASDKSQLALVVGLKTQALMLSLVDSSGNVVVTTIDKLGPQATILTGELGRMDGMSIITSPYMREDLAASGVALGTAVENRGRCVWVRRNSFYIGNKRDITVEAERKPEYQQTWLTFSARKAFACAYEATDKVAILGYGISF